MYIHTYENEYLDMKVEINWFFMSANLSYVTKIISFLLINLYLI